MSGQKKRNFWLIAINGILFRLGAVFIEVNTILPLFIKQLSGSSTLVGFVNSMGKAGWFLPQIFSAHLLDGQPYKKPLYIKCALLRCLALMSIPLIVANYGILGPKTVLYALLVSYAIYSLAGGMSGVAAMDMIGGAVDPHLRAVLFSLRWGVGGVLAIGGGYLAKVILKGMHFPNNFALLFALAATFISIALLIFTFVDEQPSSSANNRKLKLGEFIISGIKLLAKDKNYRYLYATRVFMGIWSGALPFYILYARKHLGIAAYYAGIFAIGQSLGQILPNAIWGKLGRKYGNQRIIQTGALLTAFMPFIAILVRFMPEKLWIPALWIMFFVGAAALNGIIVGSMSYMLDISPDDSRSKYIGTFNTLIAPWMFTPMLAGAFLNLIGFTWLFIISLAGGIMAGWASLRLSRVV